MKSIKFIIAFTTLLFCFRGISCAQSIVASPISGGISSCLGTASASPNIISFIFSGSALMGPVTVSAPTNFEVSLAAGTGYANTFQVAQVGGTVNNTTIYVRSAATAPTGVLSGNITLASAGAGSQMVAVTGTVSPLATINPVNDQTTSNGAPTLPIHFTGTGNYYKWVSDNPAIGMPASGPGDIASFTAVNTGNKPITANITVTPYFAGSVYVGNDVYSDVTVINTITQKVVTHIKVGLAPESVTVRPDGSLVYVGNMDSGTISVINTQSNTVVNTIPADVFPWGLCMSPDGSKLYVVGAYGQILFLDAYTYKTIASLQVGLGAQSIASSPDGKYVYIGGQVFDKSFVYVLDAATNAIVASIPVGDEPDGIVVTPDNSQVYAANYWSESVSVINTATNTVTATIDVGINPTGVTVTPDGKYVYVAVENSNRVAVINTATQSLQRNIKVGQQPFGVSVSPDGATLYAVNAYSCNVSVIDVTTQMQTDSIALEGYMQGPVSRGNFVTAGMCSGPPVTFTITVLPTLPPAITAESAPNPVSTTYGTPSAAASFNISATNLTSTVLVSPPPGFEVSSDGTTFVPTVSIGQGLGFGTTPVYIRLQATTPVGAYSGNIVLTSTGAPTVNVVMPTSQVNPAPLTITADDKIKIYLSANPPLTAIYKGFVNSETSAVFTALPVLATIAITTSPVGQYPITVGGAADSNYTITYVPGVLKVVRSLAIPNAFTPNGDGINDTWTIDALQAYSNCSVQVFTRWGRKVYFSTGYAIPWDGTLKGSPLPTGTYYYIIDLKNGTSPLSGFVAIIR